jgi:hypothetical protein
VESAIDYVMLMSSSDTYLHSAVLREKVAKSLVGFFCCFFVFCLLGFVSNFNSSLMLEHLPHEEIQSTQSSVV